jgi:putative flippase GtrA
VISKWLPFEAAIALAYLLGMTTAFLLTKAFVFKKSEVHWLLEYGRFALVNVVAFIQVLLVSEGLVRLLFPRIGFHWHPEEIGHLIGVMSPIVTSYYAHKHFSFRPAAASKATP